MTIDWKLLAKVRETQKATAQQKVAEQRKVMEEGMQQVRQAESALEGKKNAKAQYWQQLSADLTHGACDMERLRYAGAWNQALDSAIAQAGEAVKSAQTVVSEQNKQLDEYRQVLREYSGDLEKAKQMQTKTRSELVRKRELRSEDVMDEVATQRWSQRLGV